MPTEEQVQKLIEARSKHIRQASEARSVDGLLVWYASDAILSDVGMQLAPEPFKS